jgi:Mg-chelatase subunit ChlD
MVFCFPFANIANLYEAQNFFCKIGLEFGHTFAAKARTFQMSDPKEEQLKRWRLVLGKVADPEEQSGLGGEEQGMDQVLDALYDSERERGLGSSSPNVNRWLGDIRKYFPTPVVQLMQKDALDRLRLSQMLTQPELLETLSPDVQLVSTLLSLKKVLPAQTRETAREVVRKVVAELEKKLKAPLLAALRGRLNRAQRSRKPRFNDVDWQRTIRANLKHYQPAYKAIIPEKIFGFGRRNPQLQDLIILVDQSGSMADSVVYAGIFGCIMAAVPSLRTRFVVFDTSVVDLTDHLHDAVDLLFATQLGGGTHIGKALDYASQWVQTPRKTILILISDLLEGGSTDELIRKAANLKSQGVKFVTLLALNDKGVPIYDQQMASAFAGLDIPTFACTPDRFAEVMGGLVGEG